MESFKKVWHKHQHIIVNSVLIGIAIGILLFATYRFVIYSPATHTHYHANFAVYVDGVQDKFTDPLNYQEIASCTTHDSNDPMLRTHLHDEVYDVVHVHADAVTWNQFFENIGVTADPSYLRIKSNSYPNNPPAKVTYILNGSQVESLAGRVIGSEDTLLVNFGVEDMATIMQRYNAISNKAESYNQKPDPASCSGAQGATLEDRLNNIFK